MLEILRKWWAAGLACWALLAFIAWHYESTCGAFLSGACSSLYWESVRYIVLLKWVKTYQTLIAGGAAVAAGAFVLVAAKHTAESSQRAENARKREFAVVALHTVADEFLQANNHVVPATFLPSAPPNCFANVPVHMGTIRSIHWELGSIVTNARVAVELQIIQRSVEQNDVTLARGRCYAIYCLLTLIAERLSPDGRYDMQTPDKLPGSELKQLLGTSLLPARMLGITRLFDWDK